MKYPFSTHEAQLILLASHPAPDSKQTEEIKRLLHDKLDWTQTIQIALKHNVTPVLYRNLTDICPELVPRDILDAFHQHCQVNLERNKYLLQELKTINNLLKQNEISLIAFKGPLLAQQAYGSLSMRRAGDLDILVRNTDIQAVCKLLEQRGYCEDNVYRTGKSLSTSEKSHYHDYQAEYLYIRPHDMVMVEPHWRITPVTLVDTLDYTGLWQRAQPVIVDDIELLGFLPEDALLVLCIHGSKHEWRQLRWICDIAALIESHPDLDWEAIRLRAFSQGYLRILGVGLRLCQELYKTDVPDSITSVLYSDRLCEKLADRAYNLLFQENTEAPNLFTLTSFRWKMRERTMDRVRYALRTLTTPRIHHMRLVSLPPSLFFLYYPVKVIYDFLIVPLLRLTKPLRHRVKRSLADVANDKSNAEFSREIWSQRSAAWDRWADVIINPEDEVTASILEEAQIEPSYYILDLASGTGEPSLRLSQSIDATGMVVATDLIESMLVGLRKRTIKKGNAALEAVATDMSKLPFADASFDIITCRFGIMFTSELKTTLAEIYRVLRAGGRAIFTVWGPKENNALFDAMHKVVPSFLGTFKNVGELNAFRFANIQNLIVPLLETGFAKVGEKDISFVSEVPMDKPFWEPLLEMSYGHSMHELSADQRIFLNNALKASFSDYCKSGVYHFPNHARRITVAKH